MEIVKSLPKATEYNFYRTIVLNLLVKMNLGKLTVTLPEGQTIVLGNTDTNTSNTGNVTLDFAANQNFVLTLTGNTTLVNPSTESVGQSGFIAFIQDGTGSRTVSFNAAYEFKDDTAPTLTTTAAKGDLFVFRYNGSKFLEVGRNQNLTLS